MANTKAVKKTTKKKASKKSKGKTTNITKKTKKVDKPSGATKNPVAVVKSTIAKEHLEKLDKTATKESKPKKISQLDVAYKVLKESKSPMTTKDIMKIVTEKKLWQTKGMTPAATLYSAILRELSTKGIEARFKKTAPGKFAARF